MSHTVFHAALDELIERRALTDGLAEAKTDEEANALRDALSQIVLETVGNPAAFDAAVRELAKARLLAMLWPRLAEMARLANDGVERRLRALGDVTPDEIRTTPALTKEDVARRQAEKVLGDGSPT